MLKIRNYFYAKSKQLKNKMDLSGRRFVKWSVKLKVETLFQKHHFTPLSPLFFTQQRGKKYQNFAASNRPLIFTRGVISETWLKNEVDHTGYDWKVWNDETFISKGFQRNIIRVFFQKWREMFSFGPHHIKMIKPTLVVGFFYSEEYNFNSSNI